MHEISIALFSLFFVCIDVCVGENGKRRPMESIHIVPYPSVLKFLKLLIVFICFILTKFTTPVVVRGAVL